MVVTFDVQISNASLRHFVLVSYPDGFILPPDYNITPSTFQPFIRLNRETGEREIDLMRWGSNFPLRQVARGLQEVGKHQREGRDDSATSDVADPLPEAALHRPRRRNLRMAKTRPEDEEAILLLTE